LSKDNLVIVESPAKAKTINKYLGKDFTVIASYGHVRDLLNKDGSVDPDKGFEMVWQEGERSQKAISEIKKAVKGAKNIYLAPDPDREGEAIAWHVKEILAKGKLLQGKDIKRITFNEITKTAVKEALENSRDLDEHLVEAYLARRALDYLVGFNLSPILWRKLPGSRSAGRVQSVALRLICEREFEIEKFNSEEYWSIETKLHTKEGVPFTAKLTHLSGNKLGKMDIGNEDEAQNISKRIQNKNLSVQLIEKKQTRRNPSPPFITSTLQMDASRKLRMSASKTMRTAQRLYEGIELDGDITGLITYMRTDGTTLSEEAVKQSRDLILNNYGKEYLPEKPRLYKSKAKNAQEAHEAIRPTDLSRTPEKMKNYLDEDMASLYELIWKRTMASQMENAVLNQMAVTISDGTDDVILRANGSSIAFDGFLNLYQESTSEEEEKNSSNKNRMLPPIEEQEPLKLVKIDPEQHFTQPPPRFSEASLVKRLEELGIGRPSTYASILQVLRDRKYVVMDRRRFIPEDRGRLVTTFLEKFFSQYVDYDFTANLEEELDAIASGHVVWKEALRQFWVDFSKAVEETKGLTITEVIDHLNDELGHHFFPEREDGKEARLCPACDKGQLSLKLGKFGAFVGCSDYPDCRYTRPLIVKQEDGEESESAESAQLSNEPKVLGEDPNTGRTVSLRRGPYGPYVQIDLPEDADKKEKPKRQGLPKGSNPADIDLKAALKLLELPRDVGIHPQTGKKITAGIGRFGPFLLHDKKYSSIPKEDDLMSIGLNRAVVVIAEAEERRAAREAKKAEKGQSKKTSAKKKKSAKKGAKKSAKSKKKKTG
jgi:DNA topoisomerase-1